MTQRQKPWCSGFYRSSNQVLADKKPTHEASAFLFATIKTSEYDVIETNGKRPRLAEYASVPNPP
jgi:hypothetical protein